MKLTRVKINNFRSIKSVDFSFPERGFLVLVGANNAGKSNIIRAINNIFGVEWWSQDKLDRHDFYGRDPNNKICISLSFDTGETAGFKWDDEKAEHRGYVKYRSGREGFLSNDFKAKCPCTYLGADRTFDRHMSFYDWTLLGKIRKTFHQRCAALAGQFDTKFQEIVDLFDQVQGFSEFKADFAKFFSEMQADTPLKMAVDFKPFTPSNYFKAMQVLAADPSQGQADLDMEELGEGTRNLALLALLRSYAVNLRSWGEEVGGILAVEEPEIYLHPQSQRNLFRVIRDIADSGIQVVLSTHSTCFVDTEFFDSIGLVRKLTDPVTIGGQHSDLTMVSKTKLVAHCRSTGVPSVKTNVQNITEYYKTTSNYRLNEALFARFVILVEGESEELALPEYLRAAGLDCDLRGVSVIGVEGKNQIPKYWRLFSAFRIPLLVLFDNDDDGTDNNGNSRDKRRSNENVATCFGLQLDQILHSESWAGLRSVSQPETALIILHSDFEAALEVDYRLQCEPDPDFTEVVQEAKDLIKPVNKNQGKGLIARYVARKILSSKPTYCPVFIRRIADLVNAELGFTMSALEEGAVKVDDEDIAF
jgi:putative ATP-dependent endonuclease of OLD family